MTLVESIRKDAGTAQWVGIVMIIAGILSLMAPLGAGLSIAMLTGALMLVGGIGQLFVVFRAGSFGEGLLLAILAFMGIIAGGYMLLQPAAGLAVLTLFLAAYFMATGVIEIFGAFGARPAQGWGWLLICGISSLLLGAMIWLQFPISGVWAIGVLVGVRLLISGWTLTAIARAAKAATA